MSGLHYIQNEIIIVLGKAKQLKFSEIGVMDTLGIEKDSFNYHLQTLVKLGLVEKLAAGYCLSVEGKKLVSRLDFENKKTEKLPKLSVMVQLFNRDDPEQILVSKRLKHPFLHQLGLMTGKVRAGELFDDAMIREVQEESGLTPTEHKLIGVYRWIDYDKHTGDMTHDGVFLVYSVTDYTGELVLKTDECENSWMNIDDLGNGQDLLPSASFVRGGARSGEIDIKLKETKLVLDTF